MNGELEFKRGAVAPWECIKEGAEVIKGDYWLFLAITFVGILVSNAVPLVLVGPMFCGIYIAYLAKAAGGTMLFDQLFKGFDHFADSLIATLAMVGFTLVGMIPAFIPFVVGIILLVRNSGSPTGLALMGLSFLLFLILMFFVGALYIFAFPLIVDRKVSGWEAVKLSFRAFLGNFGGIIGLMLLNLVITLLGCLALFVGYVFVLPFVVASWGAAYRRVFPAQ
jgi:hypothetical protein